MSSILAPAPPPAQQATPAQAPRWRWAFWLVAVLLLVSTIGAAGYAGLSLYAATVAVNHNLPQKLPQSTPAAYGLDFRPVMFPSRVDKVQLRGWFIPGVLPDGQLTAQRALIMVHGNKQNRTDPDVGELELSVGLARHGFAVLAFDLRGSGESPAAPMGLGYFEQRDVLGAVDFLRSGPLAYPQLGRPLVIGGWGISSGAVSLLLAAAQEPALAAVVADDAFAYAVPRLEHDAVQENPLAAWFAPGGLYAARLIYGVDYFALRPVEVVAKIAPRPLFFIQPEADPNNPMWHFNALVAAAERAPNAHVHTWVVPGVTLHAQSFHTRPVEYVNRVSTFFDMALGVYARA